MLNRILILILFIVLIQACCDKKEIPELMKLLNSGKAENKNKAALALASCGEDAKGAVPILGKLIYDENVGVQSSAAYALRKIDTKEARKILKSAEERRRGYKSQ
jgi:HEAT repeat protein